MKSEWSCVLRPVPIGAALALAALAGRARADGNVSTYVDGNGDLWMFGDELDNRVRVGSGGDDSDTFLVSATDVSTTINGQHAVTLFAPGTRMILILGAGNNRASMGTDSGSNPSCCYRELIVVAGAGDDEVSMGGPFRSVTADLGPGNDFIGAGEAAGGIAGAFLMGDGDDVISVDTFAGLGGFVDMGSGDDRIHVGRGSGMNGTFRLGDGDDHVDLVQLSYADIDLDAGYGDDVIVIEGLERGSIALNTGDGNDSVHFTGARGSPRARPIDPVSVVLGDDDDSLEVGNVEIGAAVFDGGTGTDVYLDLGRTRFIARPPDLLSFDFPMGSRAPTVAFPTWITGRVVDDAGVPVPGAVVLLPERARVTSTDDLGVFRFDSVEDQRTTLEITVGASLRGRARSGAAVVELSPVRTSDAGDIVLAPGLRNVLVFGTARSWDPARFLEGNLLGLGFRPEEVTRLAELPEDLAPYGVAWHVGSPIPADARLRLANFVRAGRGLHLERGAATADASLEALVNALVIGGGIEIGVSGTATNGLYSFNPGATGGVTKRPNALTSFSQSAFSRFITGLRPRNVLLTMTTSPDVPGAVWDSSDLVGGRGHLSLLTDNTWIAPGSSLDVIENLQTFLAREQAGYRAR